MKSKKQKGFSLIELLIVVAIILIIAAIAIPKLLASRGRSVESAAAGSLRSATTALVAYQNKYQAFPATLDMLGGDCSTTAPTAAKSCQMDDAIVQGMATGAFGSYKWTFQQTLSGGGFTLNADPSASAGRYVTEHFYADEGITLHQNNTASASAADPTL